MSSKNTTTKTLIYILMFACLGYFILPLLWLLIASTKTNAGLFSSFGFWFAKDFNLFQNLSDTFSYDKGVFLLWMKNTFIYAITAALGSSLISALAGYAFSQYRFRGRNLLFGIVLGSVLVPLTVFAVPLYLLIFKLGISKSLLALILPSLVSPFGVYLMRIYADQAIPPDLIDAARMDGAGELRIFISVVFSPAGARLCDGAALRLHCGLEQLLPAAVDFDKTGCVYHQRRPIRMGNIPGDCHRGSAGDFAGGDYLPLPATFLAKRPGNRQYQRLGKLIVTAQADNG